MNQHGSSSSSSSSSTVDVSSLAIPSDQAHLLQYWDTLSPSEQASLFHQLSSLLDHQQLSQLASIVQSHTAAESSAYLSGTKPATIEPFNNAVHVNQASDKERQIWKDKGFELISHRKVAAILMAGGQGTRLGSNLPKGAIDIGLPSGKCLFQLQAERLIRTAEIAGAVKRIPWFIMTSSATHIQTIEIFKRNNFFGYEENDVVFFQQDDLPCFSDMGKIILESRCKIAMSPNGNGGIFEALSKSGSLDQMKRDGIEYVFIYSVDNVLVQVCDPEFIGYCAAHGVDFGNKVLEKREPSESVGVLATRNGKPAVVEYSEMSKELSEKRQANGQLVFNAANIAIHCVTVDFLQDMTTRSFPFHLAHKKIPHVSQDGEITIKPKMNNGYKLEKFIFDSLEYSKNPCAFFVDRFGNFSPVKNASAEGVKDSPATACEDLARYHIFLVRKFGGVVNYGESSRLGEICPLVSVNGESLENLVLGESFTTPFHIC